MVCIRQESESAREQELSVRYSKELTAEELHDATRAHWGGEAMHWQLQWHLKKMLVELELMIEQSLFQGSDRLV